MMFQGEAERERRKRLSEDWQVFNSRLREAQVKVSTPQIRQKGSKRMLLWLTKHAPRHP